MNRDRVWWLGGFVAGALAVIVGLGPCGCAQQPEPASPATREPTWGAAPVHKPQRERAIQIKAVWRAPVNGHEFDADPAAAWMAPVFKAAEAEMKARGKAWCLVDVLELDGPDDVARATGRPRYERGGEVVARSNRGTRVVYLSRPSPADLAHELGHVWLETDDCAQAEGFSAAVLDRLDPSRNEVRAAEGVKRLLPK